MSSYSINDLVYAFVEAANDCEEIKCEWKNVHNILKSGMSVYDIVNDYDLVCSMYDLIGDSSSDEDSILESIKAYDNDYIIDCINDYL